MKQGRDISDTNDSDDDESANSQKYDRSDEVSESNKDTSDDTSEAGKKVAFVDKLEQKTTTIRSGMVTKKPCRMDMGLNEATMNYFASLAELEEKEVLGIDISNPLS